MRTVIRHVVSLLLLLSLTQSSAHSIIQDSHVEPVLCDWPGCGHLEEAPAREVLLMMSWLVVARVCDTAPVDLVLLRAPCILVVLALVVREVVIGGVPRVEVVI